MIARGSLVARRQLMASLRFIVIGAHVVAHANAFAGGELPGYYQNPGIGANRVGVQHADSEYIDPFSGMLQLHHVDVVIPGNSGFDLSLLRSFNSPSRTYGTISDASSYNRTPNLGVGWNLLIGGRAFGVTGTGGACSGGTQLSFETPDGHRQGLIKQGDGSFLSPSRWKATCVAGGVQVFAPNGTRYDMLQSIAESIPNSIQAATFHYPTRIEDRNGNFATFTYSPAGVPSVLSSVNTSDGRSLSFTYTLTGDVHLLTMVSDGARNWTYSYFSTPALTNVQSGNGVAYYLERVQPPAGTAWTYDYYLTGQVGAHSLAQFWYPEGGSMVYDYANVDFGDGFGNTTVVSSKGQSGVFTLTGISNQWTFSYTPGSPGVNATTSVTTPHGNIIYKHVGYNTVGAGNLWQVGLLMERQSGAYQTETFTWDKQQIASYPTVRANGASDPVTYAPLLQSRTVNRDGAIWTTTYSNWDVYGNPQTITENGDRLRTTTRTYFTDSARWIVNVPKDENIAGSGSISRTFDAKGNLLNETKFGVSTSFTYSGVDGSLTSRTDAKGNSTTYSSHYRGIPQLEQRPAGVSIARVVDAAGNVVSQTDGAGNLYTYTYDGLRRATGTAPPVGAPTNIVWTGNVASTATRGAYVEETSHDGLGNVTLVKRHGIPAAQAADAFSRKVFQGLPGRYRPNPDGPGVLIAGDSFPLDLLGRPTELEDASGNSRLFLYSGSTVTDRDPLGKDTSYRHWSFGDPDKRFVHTIDLPNSTSIAIERDNLGNILSVAQGGVTRTYGYNGSYFLTSVTEPETGTTTYGRDALGNMTSRTAGGRTTNFSYDGLNRLTGITYPSGTVTIAYYGNGKTQSIANAQATRTFMYDANANLTSETLVVGGQTFTVGYAYNGNDGLLSMTYPKTGEMISYAPDPVGRPTTATPYVNSITYLDSGNPKDMVLANGLTVSLDETWKQQPYTIKAQRTDLSQPAVVDKVMSYYSTGNMYQYYDQVNPAQGMLMNYDEINQLTSVRGPWGTALMRYDAVGNMTTYDVGVQDIGVLGYHATTNRLSSFNGRVFGYDAWGNTTSDGLHAYQFDDASNLTCVDCGTASQVTYTYDGNNRRVTRTKGAETTYFVNTANGDLIMEYTVPTNVALVHIYVQGKRIATKRVQL